MGWAVVRLESQAPSEIRGRSYCRHRIQWSLTMNSSSDKLLARHSSLVHSEKRKVVSHVQRESGEWFINTVLIDDLAVPFRYKRKKLYKSLVGAQVNLTYYPATETVAGVELEVMRVVRIRRT